MSLSEVVEPDRVGAGVPSMVIARGYGKGPMRLGLDEPLDLLGGHSLGPDGIAASTCLAWVPGLANYVADACRRQAAAGRSWFMLPPTALVGWHDEYALHLASGIAHEAGVPIVHVDLAKADLGEPAADVRRHSDLVLPPMLVVAMAASGCANPLILVTGADAATPDACARLATMIDSRSSRHWACDALKCVLDLGAITWLIVARNEHSLDTALYSRVREVRIDTDRHQALRTLDVAMAAMTALDLTPADVTSVIAPMIDEASWAGLARQPVQSARDTIIRQLERAAQLRDA